MLDYRQLVVCLMLTDFFFFLSPLIWPKVTLGVMLGMHNDVNVDFEREEKQLEFHF